MTGVKTGSFDLCEDGNGGWYFLEFNPSGQFLMLEDLCPDMSVVDFFSNFIIEEAQQSRISDTKVSYSRFVSEQNGPYRDEKYERSGLHTTDASITKVSLFELHEKDDE